MVNAGWRLQRGGHVGKTLLGARSLGCNCYVTLRQLLVFSVPQSLCWHNDILDWILLNVFTVHNLPVLRLQ